MKSKLVSHKYFKNPWYTNEVKKLSDARNSYHKLFQAKLVTKAENSLFRNKITNLLRKIKVNFYHNSFARNSGNIKKTWKLINQICNRTKRNSIEKIIHNDETIVEPFRIAETFNNFFVSIADNLAANLPSTSESPYKYMSPNLMPHLKLAPITENECSQLILSLKNTKVDIDHINVDFF